jgi:hypothetical protein
VSTATTDTATLDAERYLKAVTPFLAGLPAEERADLLDDLAQHLREIAAEPGPPLAERLGSPEAYAAELLASAGVATERRRPLGPPLLARVTALAQRAQRSWLAQEAVRLSPVLKPAWWVARAYLAVSLLAALQPTDAERFPIPELGGHPIVGLLAVHAAMPLSVRLGQRALAPSGRLLVVGANAVLFVYAISLLTTPRPTDIRWVEVTQPPTAANRGCLANASGQPITNLYAYDTEGRLLDPVLLYDQDGHPIDNLCPEVDWRGRRLFTEYGRDVNGAPVINAFPRRQTATAQPGRPGLPETTTPVRPPAVVVPRLAPTTTTTLPTG